MSDCSTKAMMPKERRTCGTCIRFALEPYKRRSGACLGSYDRETCTYHATSVHRTESDCPWCPGWGEIKDEQCHERLEQVARGMYRVIAMFETRFEAEHYSPSEWAPERGAITKSTKEQLEGCGVSVDGV